MLFLLALCMLSLTRNSEVIYQVEDMETLSFDISFSCIIRYRYTPLFNTSALVGINVTTSSSDSPVNVTVGPMNILLTTIDNTASVSLATLASVTRLSNDSEANVIDFRLESDAPMSVNFTVGLFKELLHGSQLTIISADSLSQQIIPLANDGLHDILLTFNASSTDSSVSKSKIDYTIELFSQPFSSKKEIIHNPTILLLRSVGNTYQYSSNIIKDPSRLSFPKHLFMESSFYYLMINVQTMYTSLTITYAERYQRFTPSLQIDYYNVPIHYTIGIFEYEKGTQILMSSNCLSSGQNHDLNMSICLRYNIIDKECSLELKGEARYAWMTVPNPLPTGYLSSVYVAPTSTSRNGVQAKFGDINKYSRCKIFLTNVHFITERTTSLSFIQGNNKNRYTLLIIDNSSWIEDELMIVVTLRPFHDSMVTNFRPYVQLLLSTQIIYPDEIDNEDAFIMNFRNINGYNYVASSIEPNSFDNLINKSVVFRLRPADFPMLSAGSSIYMKLEYSVDLELWFLRETRPTRLGLNTVYGDGNVPLSPLNFYYLDIGHTQGLSLLGGYFFFEICMVDLFLPSDTGRAPITVGFTGNMAIDAETYLEIHVSPTNATVTVPIYSTYSLFIQILNMDYLPLYTSAYRIAYLSKLSSVLVTDPRVRVHSTLSSTIVEVDGAQSPPIEYNSYPKKHSIYIAYAAYLVSAVFTQDSEQPYPIVPISRCGLEAALRRVIDSGDVSGTKPVYRVSDWVVFPAIDNIDAFDPDFIQNENTWSMVRFPTDMPSYKHNSYYLVVVAAVDIAASKLSQHPVVDSLWNHTIDPVTLRLYNSVYLSSSFKSDNFLIFKSYTPLLIPVLLSTLWGVSSILFIVSIAIIILFIRTKYYHKRSSKIKSSIRLLNADETLSQTFSQQNLYSRKNLSKVKVRNIQIDLGHSSADNLSVHSLPLLQSTTPTYSSSQVHRRQKANPLAQDLSSFDNIPTIPIMPMELRKK